MTRDDLPRASKFGTTPAQIAREMDKRLASVADLKQPAALPVVESMADLVAKDPARVYSHRTRIEDLRIIPLHKPAIQWRKESLERLLADVRRTP